MHGSVLQNDIKFVQDHFLFTKITLCIYFRFRIGPLVSLGHAMQIDRLGAVLCSYDRQGGQLSSAARGPGASAT